MRIIKLTAENVKRLKAVEITPDGDVVVIAGRNGQGKSSVLDSIWYALEGGTALKGTKRPLRDGEDHGAITLDLGDIVVTRTFTGNGTSLTVSNADGSATFNSPQKMLDKLIGSLSFDPLGFTQMDEKTQLATLVDLVELPFDLDEMADKRQTLYAHRTEAGRELKALQGQLAALAAPDDDTPTEEVSATTILDEQNAHMRLVENYQAAQERVAALVSDRTEMAAAVAALEAELDAARDTLAQDDLAIAAAKEAAEALEAPPEVDFHERLAGVEDTNRRVREAKSYAETAGVVERIAHTIAAFTEGIELLDKEKESALSAATLPIDGLSFDDSGVTYNGIPFSQCSSAEQLRVSMAMAMALNPEIRVIRIMDGSLLDSENMGLIAEMAAEKDYQVWAEVVDESGKVGITIEDGEVVG
jgi:DNA repair exonuclease SbcCD ATPase subunit